MNVLLDEDHGPGLRLAQCDVGAVSVCACGVITLTLQYLSLRLEPDAFRSLAQMLAQAQARLERHAGQQTDGDDAVEADPHADPHADTATDTEASAPALPLPRFVH